MVPKKEDCSKPTSQSFFYKPSSSLILFHKTFLVKVCIPAVSKDNTKNIAVEKVLI